MSFNPTPLEILKNVFGYEQYKPVQREVIENVLKKRDTLAIMPTGGGKSLCFQIPALIFPGLTVVVSPLIALMKDQVEQLRELGIAALFLNSSLSQDEYQANMARVRRGEIKLLYVAPETLLTQRVLTLLDTLTVDCLTIDEAHCISEWGHDFRPEYRQLVTVRERFPDAVCLALTATATPRVRADIKTQLSFQNSNEFVASFNRENLFIEVLPKNDPAEQTLDLLKRFEGQSGIIYCFSRKQVDDLSSFLARKGYSVRPYHAGLDDEARKKNQELFIRDDVQIIVATIAFGMGINKPNVRFVMHYDLPKSIEGYYQEIGRAGRDGLPAHCLLLYSQSDIVKLRYFINQKEDQEREIAYRHLRALTDYAEASLCRRRPLLGYFGEDYAAENCEMCDNCQRGESQQVDITIPAQKFLSCVKRTGERFGANHVTQVLLGIENEKIIRLGHQSLSTFGIGKELNQKQWMHLARQLVEQGLLARGNDIYQVLGVTQRGNEVLKNREPVMGVLLSEQETRKGRKLGEVDYDPVLFDLLKKKRKELADAARIPPYVIFSDKTLVEMAAYYPMTPARMTEIFGIGQAKMERYGVLFMEVIKSYCLPLNLQEKKKAKSREAASTGEKVTKLRHIVVGEAYNSGQSIDEMVDHFKVQKSTILNYLVQYAQEGHPLRKSDDFLSQVNLSIDQILGALKAFEELGGQALKPVFDRMNGAISYEDLKLLRLHYLSRLANPVEKKT